ncbi:MAG: hypothetical protein K6B15_07570 [Parasporobacterium sp.]|nr:hypothetical protein [Parasporobacterium sp.]
MTYETKLSNIILRLKEVRKHHPEITLQKISEHTGVSFTTVSRIFADGSENQSFRYESVRPIAQMLLGMDNLDEGEEDEKALKAIIQFKDAKIKELEQKLIEEKERHERKLEKERVSYRTSIDFLKHQIELKDTRIDTLFDMLHKK